MITAIVVMLVLFGISYQRRSLRRKGVRKSVFYQYRKPLILLGGSLLPIILFNVFRPTVYPTPEKQLRDARRLGKEYVIFYAMENMAKSYPDSIPLQFDFIDQFAKYYEGFNKEYRSSDYTPDNEDQDLLTRYYHGITMNQAPLQDGNIRDSMVLELRDDRFGNYVNAIHYFRLGNMKSCEWSLLKEIELNPAFDRSYQLYYLLLENDEEKLLPFLTDSENSSHLDPELLRDRFFEMGAVVPYINILFKRSFYKPDAFALIAGLFITIMWLLFLRAMDMFEKERWIDIIVVFLGGVFMTSFCLFFYDFAHVTLNLGITGDGFSDFLYCTGVIGLSEEIVKAVPWLLFALLSKRMNEPYDYILYACVSALGFAFTENLMYLENPESITGRTILSTVGHMFDASVFAYGVILARYRFKQMGHKILSITGAFVVACLSHGFYDFWLISPAYGGNWWFMTILFFLISLHIWFYMINNAMNHSAFYDFRSINIHYPRDLIAYGVIAMVLIQFVILSIEDGARYANSAMTSGAWIAVVFILYMELVFERFAPMKGQWMRFDTMLPKGVTSLFRLPDLKSGIEELYIGQSLRFFAPKTNPYVGHLLPISGTCIREMEVSGNPGWYLVHLDRSLGLALHHEHSVLVKPKAARRKLTDDKIEVYLMVIPRTRASLPDEFEIDAIRFTGRVYSRPI